MQWVFAWEDWIFRSDKGHVTAHQLYNHCVPCSSGPLPCGNSSDHTWSHEEMDLYLSAQSHHPAEHKRAFKLQASNTRKSLKSQWTDTSLNQKKKKNPHCTLVFKISLKDRGMRNPHQFLQYLLLLWKEGRAPNRINTLWVSSTVSFLSWGGDTLKET